jgi:hypothetical protein
VTGRSETQKEKHGTKHGCSCLVLAAKLAGWATPDANAMNLGEGLETWDARQVKNKAKHGNGNGAGMPLAVQAQTITGWVSPTAQDGDRGSLPPRPQDTGTPLSQQVSGLTPASSSAETANTAAFQLNPHFSLWLMGFPTSWHAAGVSALRSFEAQATPSSRKTLPSSSKPTSMPRKLLT